MRYNKGKGEAPYNLRIIIRGEVSTGSVSKI